MVPPAVSDVLAGLLTDELACQALPAGWREAALAAVERLRPDVPQMLGVADQGEGAVRAARQLEQEVRPEDASSSLTVAEDLASATFDADVATTLARKPKLTFPAAAPCALSHHGAPRHGALVAAQLPHLLSGTVAPRAWLQVLACSLLALDLAPRDTALLETMVQVRGGAALFRARRAQVQVAASRPLDLWPCSSSEWRLCAQRYRLRAASERRG